MQRCQRALTGLASHAEVNGRVILGAFQHDARQQPRAAVAGPMPHRPVRTRAYSAVCSKASARTARSVPPSTLLESRVAAGVPAGIEGGEAVRQPS